MTGQCSAAKTYRDTNHTPFLPTGLINVGGRSLRINQKIGREFGPSIILSKNERSLLSAAIRFALGSTTSSGEKAAISPAYRQSGVHKV